MAWLLKSIQELPFVWSAGRSLRKESKHPMVKSAERAGHTKYLLEMFGLFFNVFLNPATRSNRSNGLSQVADNLLRYFGLNGGRLHYVTMSHQIMLTTSTVSSILYIYIIGYIL